MSIVLQIVLIVKLKNRPSRILLTCSKRDLVRLILKWRKDSST